MNRLVVVALLLTQQGCIITAEPGGDDGYEDLIELNSVAGCYRNLGEDGGNDSEHYLSQILWPAQGIKHEKIQFVDVSVSSEKSVVASGIEGSVVVVEGEFIEGRHFDFESGKITITNEIFGSLAYPAGNPFIGAGHKSVTLGLDQAGNGKLTESSTFAGTVFLFVPVAGRVSDSIRFVRVGDRCRASE